MFDWAAIKADLHSRFSADVCDWLVPMVMDRLFPLPACRLVGKDGPELVILPRTNYPMQSIMTPDVFQVVTTDAEQVTQ